MNKYTLNIHFDVGGSQVAVEIDGSDKHTVSGNMTLSVELDEGKHHIKCLRISKYTKRIRSFGLNITISKTRSYVDIYISNAKMHIILYKYGGIKLK